MIDPQTPLSAPAPRTPRWERRKESRHAELLAAAIDLFVERGFAATRLDEVAARAGVSKGTLYLYFQSKEDLFKAVVTETLVPLLANFERSLAAANTSNAERLALFFRVWWERFGATRLAGIAKLVLAEAGNFPELARFFHQEVIARNDELLRGIVQAGIDVGEFRPVNVQAACHLWMAPLVLKAIWSRSFDVLCPVDEQLSTEQFLAEHVTFVLASLRPPA